MDCRTFENHIADWIRGSLSGDISKQMTAHQSICRNCAQAAAEESHTREYWNDWTASVDARSSIGAPDIWPRLEARLTAPRQHRVELSFIQALRGYRGVSTWLAPAALAATILIAVCCTITSRTIDKPGHPNTPIALSPPASRHVNSSLASRAVSLSIFGDSGQSDVNVDDPIDVSMEQVWTHVNAAKTSRQEH